MFSYGRGCKVNPEYIIDGLIDILSYIVKGD